MGMTEQIPSVAPAGVARLIAIEAVRDLVYRYAFLLDTDDGVALAALFARARIGAADSGGVVRGALSQGADALLRISGEPGPLVRGAECLRHFTSRVRVEIAALNRRAAAISCVVTLRRTPRQGWQVVRSNHYFDQLEDNGSGWFFSQRLVWTEQPDTAPLPPPWRGPAAPRPRFTSGAWRCG